MNLNLTSITRIGLNVLALLGASFALYLGQSVFMPLIIAALLAVLLWPAANWLHRRLKFPWFLACASAISMLVFANVLVIAGFALAVPQTLQELPNPRDPEQLKQAYYKARNSLKITAPANVDRILPANHEESTVYAYATKFFEGGYVTDTLLNVSKMAANWLFHSIIVLFILLFLLLEGEFLAARIKGIFGADRVAQTQATRILADMGKAIRSYLVWRTLVNIGLGLFLGVFYSVMNLNQPWTWALLTGVLNYVPYIGPLIAGVPPLADALIHVGPQGALIVLIMYIVVINVEGYLIVPLVMGRSMDLNATTVMMACLYWDLVWGTPGLFLAMPLMAGVRSVCMHVEGLRPWGELMGTEHGYTAAAEEARLAAMMHHEQTGNEPTQVMEGAEGK